MCLFQIIKDVLESLASIATVAGVGAAIYYGRLGLEAWKSQVKGAADHELSRRVLVLLYKYQAAMSRLRSPVSTSHDFKLRDGETPDPDFEVERFNQMCRGFDRKWDSLSAVRLELDGALLECRALWGESMDELFDSIDGLENEWYMCMLLYIRSNSPMISKEGRLKWSEELNKRKNVLHDDGGVDEFRQRFESSLSLVEAFLKSKLA